MHELAITQSIVDLVVERTTGRQVGLVRVEVGVLSGVVPDSMQFCYELISSGTTLEGSRLVIEKTPGSAHCRSCDQNFVLNDLILLCPCGSADVDIVTGRELRILSVELVVESCA
jgi:hydrogenase nickel incorporation protein HypA/HybF